LAFDHVCHLQFVTLVIKVTDLIWMILLCMVLHDEPQGISVLTLYLLVAQETRPQAPCGPQTAPRSFLILMGQTWRWVCTIFIPLQSCLLVKQSSSANALLSELVTSFLRQFLF